MPTATYPLTIGVLFALMASGQTPAQTVGRVFHFAHTPTDRGAQEIATSVRTIADMNDAVADFGAGTLTVNGTADQVQLAEWLFVGMDRTVPVLPDAAVHEYRMPSGADNVVRTFYLDSGQTVQEFQEFATMLRTLAEIRRVFTFNEGKILVLRGTADQMSMADWFTSQLAKSAPAPHPHSVTPAYLLPADPSPRPNENVTRIFFVANAGSIQDFQQIATLTRTIAEIRRVFTYNTPRAMALRGTAAQLTFAEWLFNEIDQPRGGEQGHASGTYTYPESPDAENATQVFYLSHTATVQDFQEIARTIRTTAGIRRVFTYNSPRAMAVRGTLNQLEQTRLLLTELDPADFPKSQ